MSGLFNNLQKKPEESRRRIALIIAGVITLIIFGAWLATFSLRNNSTVARESGSPFGDTVDRLSQFINQGKEIFGSIKGRVDEVKEAVTTIATTTEFVGGEDTGFATSTEMNADMATTTGE
jgi:hypothetical protein